MAHLIDKSALVAEIERLKTIYKDDENIHHVAKYNILVDILSFLDTLEVKEDEINYIYALAACIYYGEAKGYTDTETHQKTNNWLKSLKERYTWKPSDKQMRCLCEVLNNSTGNSYDVLKSLFDELKKLNTIAYLQDISFKDRHTWNPSDEQIKVCKEVYADVLSAKGFDVGTINSELNRLVEQLKKLREE